MTSRFRLYSADPCAGPGNGDQSGCCDPQGCGGPSIAGPRRRRKAGSLQKLMATGGLHPEFTPGVYTYLPWFTAGRVEFRRGVFGVAVCSAGPLTVGPAPGGANCKLLVVVVTSSLGPQQKMFYSVAVKYRNPKATDNFRRHPAKQNRTQNCLSMVA